MDTILTTFEPDQRDSWGQYSIPNGNTHVFPFSIPFLQGIKISTAHIMPNSQDFSVLMWITSKPLDGIQLEQGFGRFKPIRRTQEFMIFDSLLKSNEEDERLFLQSGVTFYLNVKNLQNRTNAYELNFDIISPTP